MVEILTHAQKKLTNAGLEKHRTRSVWLFLMRFGWSKSPMVRQHQLAGVEVAHAIAGSSFMVEILIFLPQGGGGGGASRTVALPDGLEEAEEVAPVPLGQLDDWAVEARSLDQVVEPEKHTGQQRLGKQGRDEQHGV